MESEKKKTSTFSLEQAVLGQILLFPNTVDSVVSFIPNPSIFEDEAHRIIYREIIDIYAKGENADLLTVFAALKKRQVVDAIGGAHYLTELTEKAPPSTNVGHHATIIAQEAIRRKTKEQAQKAIYRAQDESRDAFDVVEAAISDMEAITSIFVGGAIKTAGEIAPDVMRKIEETVNERKRYHEEGKEYTPGISTGFKWFDQVTAGLHPDELLIIAARPAMGKTAFALNIALNAAVKKTPVLFFSLEMSRDQLVLRLLSNLSGVNGAMMRRGILQPGDFGQLQMAQNILHKLPLYIDDNPNTGILEIRIKAKQWARKNPGGVVIVDYLQLMNGGSSGKQNREREIADMSRGLKVLSKELHMPVIALSQLSRALESRASKKPMLSDLRESGAIEQDADAVIFLYRPIVYGDDYIRGQYKDKIEALSPVGDGLEIISKLGIISLAKQRHGPTLDFPIRWYGDTASYKSITDERVMAAWTFPFEPDHRPGDARPPMAKPNSKSMEEEEYGYPF